MKTSTLFALGFRPFYLAAAVFSIAAMLLWLASFTGSLQFGHYLQGMSWHGHEMVYGFLVAVIAGFQFTAVRSWTGRPTPTGALLAGIVGLWILARVLLVTGPTRLAVVIDILFLPVLGVAVAIPIFGSRNARNYKIVGLVVALAALHIVYHLAMSESAPAPFARGALFASVDVIVILFALIGGRVIPAFTRNAVAGAEPMHQAGIESVAFASLSLLALLSLVQGASAVPPSIAALLAVVAAAAHAVRLAFWQPWLTAGNPLLWMLPVAYSWLPLALALRACGELGLVTPGTWLHAMTTGAVTSMIFAMMMRSSLGHTGRPLAAQGSDMAVFLLIQLGALLRVFAGMSDAYRTLVMASGAVWTLAFVVFLFRYVPILIRRRVDGKPG